MYGFKAFVFDGKRTAGKALDTLEDYAPAYVWIDDVATVSKSKHGHMRVHSTWAQDDSNVGVGTGLGAMTGAMTGGCPRRLNRRRLNRSPFRCICQRGVR
jgi:uncharacterized membrane protein